MAKKAFLSLVVLLASEAFASDSPTNNKAAALSGDHGATDLKIGSGNAVADTVLGSAADEASEKQNKAFDVSPQDKVYDTHKIDDNDKFHAPTVAPNDLRVDVSDIDKEDDKNSQITHDDAEKGKKGSVILADYDSNRLGVSADEAKTGVKGEDKKEKHGSVSGAKPEKAKPKPKTKEDALNAVNENKASTQKEKAAKQGAKDTIEQKETDAAEEKEAKFMQSLKEKHDSTTVANTGDKKAQKVDPEVQKDASEEKKEAESLKKQDAVHEKIATTTTKAAQKISKDHAARQTTTDIVAAAAAAKVHTQTAHIYGRANTPAVAKDVKAETTTHTTTKHAAAAAAATLTADPIMNKNSLPVTASTSQSESDNAANEALALERERAERKQEKEFEQKESGIAKKPYTSAIEEAPVEATRLSRLIGSASMIIISELGDKTFFIAALMAMRHNQWFVFSSSYSAMVVMTVMSMCLGSVLPTSLSRKVTALLAALSFFVFAAKMLREAWSMDRNSMATEEMEEVEQDSAMDDHDKSSEKAEGGGVLPEKSLSMKSRNGLMNLVGLVFSPVWIQIFMMTFLGEWGDRSQIATVAMGAGEGFMPVLVGCLFGHFVTTSIAVMGGKMLAKQLSLRTITFGGAACFLAFGIFNIGDWVSQQ